MNELLNSTKEQARAYPFKRIVLLIRKNHGTWQSVAALSGLAGGTLSLVLATLLTIGKWFIHSQGAVSFLNILSVVLFVLTIPLLALGAHCLDLLEAKVALPSTGRQPAEAASKRVGSRAVPRNA